VGELVSYRVFGAECYVQFRLFEKICNVGGFSAYIGEAGPFFLGSLGNSFGF